MCGLISKQLLEKEARSFRKAILRVNENGGFSADSFHQDNMDHFPYDCCDDVSDLFSQFLLEKYKICCYRVRGSYYDSKIEKFCCHVWLEFEGLIIDLTGDQFLKDSALKVKCSDVYVDKEGAFHRQFKDKKNDISCGIENYSGICRERMNKIYKLIIEHM